MGLHFATADRPKERRIKRLAIEADMFLHILRGQDGTNLLQAPGMPDDARIVGFTVDEVFNTIVLYCESKEFDEVPPLCTAPDWDLYFTRYNPEVVGQDQLLFTVGEDVVKRYLECCGLEPQVN